MKKITVENILVGKDCCSRFGVDMEGSSSLCLSLKCGLLMDCRLGKFEMVVLT